MIKALKRQAAAIARLPSSRGFGIQSPWAFHLMTDVIAYRAADNAYAAVEDGLTTMGNSRREFCRLMYRLARRFQPALYAGVMTDPLCESYIVAASPKITVRPWRQCRDSDMALPMLLYADVHDAEALQMAVAANGDSLLVVSGIRQDDSGKKLWAELRDSPTTGVTFDLYDHALLFFDHKRPKQHYRGPCF